MADQRQATTCGGATSPAAYSLAITCRTGGGELTGPAASPLEVAGPDQGMELSRSAARGTFSRASVIAVSQAE
jgi:hypothetical protein